MNCLENENKGWLDFGNVHLSIGQAIYVLAKTCYLGMVGDRAKQTKIGDHKGHLIFIL